MGTKLEVCLEINTISGRLGLKEIKISYTPMLEHSVNFISKKYKLKDDYF